MANIQFNIFSSPPPPSGGAQQAVTYDANGFPITDGAGNTFVYPWSTTPPSIGVGQSFQINRSPAYALIVAQGPLTINGMTFVWQSTILGVTVWRTA